MLVGLILGGGTVSGKEQRLYEGESEGGGGGGGNACLVPGQTE